MTITTSNLAHLIKIMIKNKEIVLKYFLAVGGTKHVQLFRRMDHIATSGHVDPI